MTDGDLDQTAALLGDPDVMRYYPAPKNREEARQWIEWDKRNYAEHGFGLWVAETVEGDFIGDCGLTWQAVDGTREIEVGYHVRSDAQGNGFGDTVTFLTP
jgi:RimJ/RimL family protein N-acetyltransferase